MGIEKKMNTHQGGTRGDDLGSLNNLTVGEGKQVMKLWQENTGIVSKVCMKYNNGVHCFANKMVIKNQTNKTEV